MGYDVLDFQSIPLGGMFYRRISMKLRLFKTRRFAEAATKAWICDSELREAFGEMLRGQADNLGGGVWKKRLNQIGIVPSYWPRAGTIGSISCYSRRRIKATLLKANLFGFDHWPKLMKG